MGLNGLEIIENTFIKMLNAVLVGIFVRNVLFLDF